MLEEIEAEVKYLTEALSVAERQVAQLKTALDNAIGNVNAIRGALQSQERLRARIAAKDVKPEAALSDVAVEAIKALDDHKT